MRAWFERFLNREWQRRSGWQILLQPLSWLFTVVTAIRRALYQNHLLTTTKIGVPVIIVGIIVGTALGGALGAFLIVPILGTARVIVLYLMAKVMQHDPFPGEVMPEFEPLSKL